MNVMDRLRAAEKQLGEIWKELTPFRGAGGGGGVPAHHLTHEPGGADAITIPPAHHTRHESGGADVIKLDDLGTPDDNTDLNASAAKHGLLPKLSNVVTEFLNGQGVFSTPSVAPAAHHTTHESGGGDAIKLDDLAAPDDNTDLDVSINKHGLTPKAPNDTGKFLRGDGTWQKLTSGGANIQKLWTPDLFPTGYAAQCDHFDDASLDAKWTAFQAHAALTVTESGSHLKMVDTGNGAATHNLRGYYQALPAGDFTIIGKFAHIPDMSSEQGTFLALFQDATNNPNTCDIYTLGAYSAGAAPYVLVSHWSQWDTFGSNPYVGNLYVSWPSFFRIRHAVVGGTHTWFFDISYDAHSWYRVYRAPEVWTPDAFGILVDNRTAANVLNSWFDWIYYVNSDVVTPPGSTADFWIT